MKIRSGFVSNSSSSSFVVAFKKVPESVEELQKLLFGKGKTYPKPYAGTDKEQGWTAEEVAYTVWEGIKHGHPLLAEHVKNTFRVSGSMFGDPKFTYSKKYHKLSEEQQQKQYGKHERKLEVFRNKKSKEFLNANPGCTFYRFEYSDNDGTYYAALEHGNLFRRLPHVRFSHH